MNYSSKRTQSSRSKGLRAKIEKFTEDFQLELPQKTHARLCAINDGVIAVVITIMVLEIPAPTSGEISYHEFLVKIAIFLISFFIVANFWYENHMTFTTFEKATNSIVILNFMFLAALALVPVMTKWVMTDISEIAAINYGAVYILVSFFSSLLFYFAHRNYGSEQSRKMTSFLFRRMLIITAFDLFLLALALVEPYIAMALFLFLPLLSFFFRFRK